MDSVSLRPWLFAGALLPLLMMSIPVSGVPTPPDQCSDCGNYIRYGFITADFAGWTPDEGVWVVSDRHENRGMDRNAAWPRRLNSSGMATMFQRFELPSYILEQAPLPAPSDRYWLGVSYRKRNRRPGTSSFDLEVFDGSGALVHSETYSTDSVNWRSSLFGPENLGLDPTDNRLTLWVTAHDNNLLIDDIAFWVENTQDKAGFCRSVALSSTGEAVKARLDELTAEGDNYFSKLTRCNNLPGDENPFPRGWLNDNPDVGRPPTPGDSEAFYQAIGDELRKTSATFVLSSLHFDGRPLDSGATMVETYLAPALRDLSDRFSGVGPDLWPSVRILLSEKVEIIDPHEEYPGSEMIFEELTSEFRRNEQVNVKVSVGEIGSIPDVSWNHTKIAARDRQFAIVGGQNWELRYLQPEDGVSPTYDLNMRIQGDAARAADWMFEKLWARRSPLTKDCTGDHCATAYPSFPSLPPVGDYSPLNVFALGRGHTSSVPIFFNLDQSADHGVVAALSAAEESIDVSQHLLQLLGGYADIVWNAIFDRMLDAPITVQVIVSDPWGEGPPLSVQTQAILATSIFTTLADRIGLSLERRVDVLCRLYWAPFRATSTDPNLEFNTHNKFWRVDGEAFYIGSQNFYPSAIGRSVAADLNEFGFMVDDRTFAQEVGTAYFDVAWQLADVAGEVFRSGLVEGLCPVVEPELEICDGIDNDLDGDIDEGGVCGCVSRSFGDSSYEFCDTAIPWDVARSACQALDGDLAKIESSAENAWIDSVGGTQDRWLGLSDTVVEGDWRWTDGTAAAGIYTNWSTFEPNGGTNENCANMWDGGAWNDLNCTWNVPFVCEIAAPVGERACALGSLVYRDPQSCLVGTVTVPVDLFRADGVGGWDYVETRTPGPLGRLCLNLDWGVDYRLEATEDECFGYLRRCQAILRRQDAAAAGTCGDSDPDCEELGEMDFFCDS